MRPTVRKPISSHRVRRFTAWARLWLLRLMWLAQRCGLAALWIEPYVARRIPQARRAAAYILFMHALVRMTPRRQSAAFHVACPRRAGALRALIGARVRRRLRRAGLAELLALMSSPEAAAATILKALRRGFARRRRKPGIPLGATPSAFAASALTAACDTS